MATQLTLQAFALSDKGRIRSENEDNFLLKADTGLFAVADGMGGHAAGEVASAAVVGALERIGPQESAAELLRLCEERLSAAHHDIVGEARRRGVGTMGSTVVVLLAFDHHYACLWAGDSRAYLLREGAIVQITHDHTEVAELVAEGVLTMQDAHLWPRRNVITRAVGAGHSLALDFVNGQIEPGDIFILCSDGLTAHLADDEIACLASSKGPSDACRDLVDLALQRGGADNVTVLVARCGSQEATTRRLPSGFFDGATGPEAGQAT
ncbi:PP2C family protein-serine/threonine phosphatase [Beijerinckia mobilis]|uniref:PP2C family protein-serine/threonine phosphatase n=1 Tax=Beijerinckia mobilis TaxID=231434 RepID=UPI00068DDF79|nr:protein phosphatase 2C domain-containing protein [Beijerinckia mobilis]